MFLQVIKKLQEHIDKPVILSTQNQEKPSYPFIAYTVTSYYIKGLGQEVRTIEDVEDGIKEKRLDQAQFVISFTAHDIDAINCYQLARDMRSYFVLKARYELDCAIVEIGNIETRDTLIVDDYERRAGFDVRFRLAHETSFEYEDIQEVNAKKQTYTTKELEEKWLLADILNIEGFTRFDEQIEYMWKDLSLWVDNNTWKDVGTPFKGTGQILKIGGIKNG